jgi:hypothetical protein
MVEAPETLPTETSYCSIPVLVGMGGVVNCVAHSGAGVVTAGKLEGGVAAGRWRNAAIQLLKSSPLGENCGSTSYSSSFRKDFPTFSRRVWW